ncbi:tapasin-related protein [Arapaima gigas]
MLLTVGFIFIGCVASSASGSGADVVLSCSLVEEGEGMGGFGGMGGGGLFSRTPATLVLRDLSVTSDLSLDSLTPYNPPAVPDPEDLIFEVRTSSLEIPEADQLLHADCDELEVTCDISQYLHRGAEDSGHAAYFIGSVQVEGGGISLTLVLRMLSVENETPAPSPLIQSKLKLPLSQSGTLLVEVAFLVFSRTQSVMAPIGGEAFLDCGFKLQDPPPVREMKLEWRLQYRGNGRTVLEMTTSAAEEEPTVVVQRQGSAVDSGLAVQERNVSLSLRALRVTDEGSYICTVSSALFQAQQVVQLHVVQMPRVSLSVDKSAFRDDMPGRASCHCERYYPLDVQVEWFSLPPAASEPVSLSKDIALSSHRQYSDGTFSLSSYLTLYRALYPPGTNITCRVSHFSMDAPVSLSFTVSDPEPDQSYLMVLGLLAATGLFLYRLLR